MFLINFLEMSKVDLTYNYYLFSVKSFGMMPLLSLVALDLMLKYSYIREHRLICFTYSELVFLGENAMQIYVNWNTCLCKTTCDYASLNLQEKFC